MENKIYKGIRVNNVAKVFVDAQELSMEKANTLHLSDATPEWSYFGDGPSQTSLAILYDAIQHYPDANEIALKYMHDFKFEFIAPADYSGFIILQSQILEWVNKHLSSDTEQNWLI